MTDDIAQRDEDARWRSDGERYGWVLPRRAAWPLRLPGIRTLRAMWLDYRVHQLAGQFASVGIGLGGPNPRDLWIIYAVARGWC